MRGCYNSISLFQNSVQEHSYLEHVFLDADPAHTLPQYHPPISHIAILRYPKMSRQITQRFSSAFEQVEDLLVVCCPCLFCFRILNIRCNVHVLVDFETRLIRRRIGIFRRVYHPMMIHFFNKAAMKTRTGSLPWVTINAFQFLRPVPQ